MNPHRARIHWINNPFLDFAKEAKNPFLDSESGLGFFRKKCTLKCHNKIQDGRRERQDGGFLTALDNLTIALFNNYRI